MECQKCKKECLVKEEHTLTFGTIPFCEVCFKYWFDWLIEAREIAMKIYLEETFDNQPERLNPEAPKGDAIV